MTTRLWAIVHLAAWLLVALLIIAALPLARDAALHADETDAPALQFLARSRAPVAPGSNVLAVRETPTEWDAQHTAIIICDMWDRHWCQGAERREAEIAPRMNHVVAAARDKGVLIVHAPSACMAYYKDMPQRRLAQDAPADPDAPPHHDVWLKQLVGEPALPIDDSDDGCTCTPPCQPRKPVWTHQIDAIEIRPDDVISDSGRELWNLFTQRGIENVILMGVHTNMCVCGRSFGLRQWSRDGKNVVLARDLTDSLYNPAMRPFVSHRRGTELVIEHIEQYICPSITSADLLGDPVPPHVVFLVGEDEYRTAETLPAFAARQLEPRGIHCTFVTADPADRNHFPRIAALGEADLLVVSARRRVLPPAEIAEVHAYLESGRPLVGIRTASHAFQGKTLTDENAAWRQFDVEVLGAHYLGHYGNKTASGSLATVYQIAPDAASQPILAGINRGELRSTASLYKNHDLAPTATILMTGHVEGQSEVEPIAWTNNYHGSRVFYTSLGGFDDFQTPAFRRLLLDAIYWGLDRQVPAAEPGS